MLLKSQETLSCDVLVIGGGGAGLRSAIAARSCAADVILAAKSRIGSCSNTYISKSSMAASGWGTEADDADRHVADTIEGGRFLNDQALAAKVAERAHAETAFLTKCGVDFSRTAEGLQPLQVPGHRYARNVHGVNWTGSDIVRPLKRRAEGMGVRFAENLFITRLIIEGNRLCGAVAITPEGRFFSLHAKVVILATGGYAQAYLNTNNVPGITGDGQVLAYDAGVPLKDMEFVQFYPTARGKRGSRLLLYEKLLVQSGVVLRNGRGENILEKNGLDDPSRVTRDQLAQWVFNEIGAGADVYLDLTELAPETAQQLTLLLPAKWRTGQRTFRVAPTTHFCMGGIATDLNGETSLRGLFAVGEVAAGVHGANRLGGNALAEIFTLGSWAGENAARRAVELGARSVPKKPFEAERLRLEATYATTGEPVKTLVQDLKQMMWAHAGIMRHEKGLKEALALIRKPGPGATVTNPAELIKLSEYQNMRFVAELVCQAALKRTESRGAHFRSDYPAEDNQKWLHNIFLRKTNSGINLETRPVDLDRIEPD